MNYNLITILGPTATGKTRLAAKLASKFNGEIISADSRQVYRGMDIGTGKDLSDYIVESKKIPYHLIDITDADQEFNLYLFTSYFKEAFVQIIKRNRVPFLTGGTGLYLSSIIQNYKLKYNSFDESELKRLSQLSIDELRTRLLKLKPKHHNKTDFEEKERIIKSIFVAESEDDSLMDNININTLVLGVKYERAEIRKRTTQRLEKRLSEGMIGEVEKLINSGITYEKLINFGLEYKFIALFLRGELTYDEMFQKLNTAIHNFSKRQMTWFRKMEREGVRINWIENGDFKIASELISSNTFINSY